MTYYDDDDDNVVREKERKGMKKLRCRENFTLKAAANVFDKTHHHIH